MNQDPQTEAPKPDEAASAPVTRDRAWYLKVIFTLLVGGTLLVALIGGGVFWYFSSRLPQLITVADYRPNLTTTVVGDLGKDPEPIGEFHGEERRYVIPYEKIPEKVVQAFISAEDDQFFQHPGINVVSILRASFANFRAGHTVQGGSTITQQVAKSLMLTPERSIVRKIKEAMLAYKMEKNLTKQQILYLYLNQIYLGHGAYGVEAASRAFFQKPVAQITLPEAAILAGMPQAPGKYSPQLSPKRAKERQLYVLKRMLENKYITQAEFAAASAQPVRIFRYQEINTRYAGYLMEHVRRYLVEKYGEKTVYEDGLTVHVPATRELALAAQKSIRDGLEAVDKRLGYRGPIQQLKSTEEIEKYLSDSRLSIIENRVGFRMLMPDGRLDPIEAIQVAGLKGESDLLEPGKIYDGVITSVDEKRKAAGAMIGAVKVEVPFEKMRWAKTVRDDKGGGGREPRTVSDVVKRGDVVKLKIAENGPKGIVASLDQEPKVQGALLSVDVKTGYVMAMEGGYDFGQSEFNRATQALRQPGSAYKPIIYAAGLEKGFTPATLIQDSPIVYEDKESGKWKPTNFEEKFYGDTTFRQALIKSRNVPTIKIVQAIQVPFLIDYSKRLGMNAQFNNDLSISLGSMSVSLLDLTKVYALFPRLGRKIDPIFISRVVDRDGKVLEEAKPQTLPAEIRIPAVDAPAAQAGEPGAEASPVAEAAGEQAAPAIVFPTYPPANDPELVLDPRVAYVMSHLMTEVVSYGTGHEAKSLGHPAAGKTGTTNDYNDAWFMGFTPQVVTGAWVGFDNHKPIGPGETGARAALPIWLSYMRDAMKPYPQAEFTVPPQIVFASINGNNGKLTPANSSTAIREAFIEGTQPTETSAAGASKPESQGDFFKEDTE